MTKYIKVFQQHSEYTEFKNSANFIRPNVSCCMDDGDVHFTPYRPTGGAYDSQYLTLEVLSSGTITIQATNASIAKTISYSTDSGDTWTSLTTSTTAQSFGTFNEGDKIMLKGENTSYGTEDYFNAIGGTAEFNVYGNIMSLIYGDDFVGETELEDYANFVGFFMETNVVSAENLVLPATTLTMGCYATMFNGCTSLVAAPELPATTLADYCYFGMFNGCTSLEAEPVVADIFTPSNQVPAINCQNMFYDTNFRYSQSTSVFDESAYGD